MNATAYTSGDIVFDRYRIERCLPQGGFSQNYVAIDTQSQQRVAIKQFFGEAIDEQYRDLAKRMFREEADMLRKFGAPNSQIPAWLSYVDERDSEPVIVQEFIEGETYEQRVTKDCVLGEPAALEFCVRFCRRSPRYTRPDFAIATFRLKTSSVPASTTSQS
ncbi:MAG: hypothetical protein HC795_08950 [Coleofasciculaceae cyanobacterium RL_1_1]|nr:hypothetical protein [Coleofasciculaceae cyanobacterium RL_1_1]